MRGVVLETEIHPNSLAGRLLMIIFWFGKKDEKYNGTVGFRRVKPE
jgi:hypothetical protein